MNDGILIIEDDPQVAQMTGDYLVHNGYSVVGTASSAEEAMTLLVENRISLVLLDIYLPEASGLDVLRTIRQQQEQIEAIILSAAKDSTQIREAFRLGCVDYIIKPFTYERLSEALDKYRKRRLLLEKDSLNQHEVDMLSGNKSRTTPSALDLPKGIDRNTLKRICQVMQTKKASFCVQDVAEELDLSRVTVKKYLDFLAEQSVLRKTYIYGNIGRPLNEYRVASDPQAYHQMEAWIA